MASLYKIALQALPFNAGTKWGRLGKTPGKTYSDPRGLDWSWEQDASDPARFKNVRCVINGLNCNGVAQNATMDVLSSLKFGPVRVAGAYANAGGAVSLASSQASWPSTAAAAGALPNLLDLPLTTTYLVDQIFAHDASSSSYEEWVAHTRHAHAFKDLWPLEVAVSSGLAVVFAYELRFRSGAAMSTGACDIAPVTLDPTSDHFFAEPFVRPLLKDPAPVPLTTPPAMTAQPGSGRVATSYLASYRVAIVVSLTLCREVADFEPGHLVGMCRWFPHVMVLSSLPFDHVLSSIALERPAKSGTQHWQPGPSAYDAEKMGTTMGSLLVADSNHRPADTWLRLLTRTAAGAIPAWDSLFTHVDVAPAGEYVAVDPSKISVRPVTAGRRHPAGVQTANTFYKAPRQGEFDNLHMAPQMLFPTGYGLPSAGVLMAPICIHDCFHLHWRWSACDEPAPNKGWSADWKPHALSGAPLVAPNQKVWINLPSPNLLEYTALAARSHANQWQVFCHHGGAYAVEGGWDDWARAGAVIGGANVLDGAWPQATLRASNPPQTASVSNWVAFYYVLRYWIDPSNPSNHVERLQLTSSELDTARKT
ncbi:MAG: hypothetical protein U0324_33960 [Polyangiales bacterium]